MWLLARVETGVLWREGRAGQGRIGLYFLYKAAPRAGEATLLLERIQVQFLAPTLGSSYCPICSSRSRGSGGMLFVLLSTYGVHAHMCSHTSIYMYIHTHIF